MVVTHTMSSGFRERDPESGQIQKCTKNKIATRDTSLDAALRKLVHVPVHAVPSMIELA